MMVVFRIAFNTTFSSSFQNNLLESVLSDHEGIVIMVDFSDKIWYYDKVRKECSPLIFMLCICVLVCVCEPAQILRISLEFYACSPKITK